VSRQTLKLFPMMLQNKIAVLEDLPLVSIVILNYNKTLLTRELLISLRRITYPEVEIILVDNASNDRSFLQLRDEFPEINIICSKENRGYAGGNNLGIQAASGSLILLLNNDTEVSRGFLEPMVDIFLSNSRAGMVSPKILYYGRGETIQYAGSDGINPWTGRGRKTGHRETDNGQYNYVKSTSLVHGACLLVSAKLIKEVGMLDESYFIYYEEHDWAERAKHKGYELFYAGCAKIYHKESMTMVKDSPFHSYYMSRNRLLFLRRNVPYPAFFASAIIFLFIAVPKKVLMLCLRSNFSSLKAYLRGVAWHLGLKSVLA
jgi:GT2 family glycosyltransferase